MDQPVGPAVELTGRRFGYSTGVHTAVVVDHSRWRKFVDWFRDGHIEQLTDDHLLYSSLPEIGLV